MTGVTETSGEAPKVAEPSDELGVTGEGGLPDHPAYYRTLLRRVGASMVDALLLAPLTYVAISVVPELAGLLASAVTALLTIAELAYSVVGHALFGRTVGKKAFGVQVLDLRGELPGWSRAALRDALPIVAAGVSIVRELSAPAPDPSRSPDATGPTAVESVFLLWAALEVVTMLTNRRRRALHDLIAGTVVIRRS